MVRWRSGERFEDEASVAFCRIAVHAPGIPTSGGRAQARCIDLKAYIANVGPVLELQCVNSSRGISGIKVNNNFMVSHAPLSVQYIMRVPCFMYSQLFLGLFTGFTPGAD